MGHDDTRLPNETAPAGERLVSLDAFRGLTIAAMILVNNPGSWAHVYPPLLHAEWHGWTPTDLIFPFFLFIVGVSMSFSLGRRRGAGESRRQLRWQVVRRSLVIFAIGLFLNGFPLFDLSSIRIFGVLQRIGFVYLFAGLAVLELPSAGLAILAVMLLALYWALMTQVPVPGYGTGDLSPDGNLAAYIDRLFLSGHMWRETWDPEGILSSMPAVATALCGALTGAFLRSGRDKRELGGWLLAAGWLGIVAGVAFGWLFPINKNLWTSSYVVFTSGAALSALGVCFWFIDVQGWQRWARPAVVLGMNPLAVFALSILFVKALLRLRVGEPSTSLYAWIYQKLFVPWAGPLNGSLAFAAANVILFTVIGALLYRRRIFFRV